MRSREEPPVSGPLDLILRRIEQWREVDREREEELSQRASEEFHSALNIVEPPKRGER